MLKDSATSRFLIRLSIYALRAIAPVGILYTLLRLYQIIYYPTSKVSPQVVADCWLIPEALFYLCIYLPRRALINRPASQYNPTPTPKDRREVLIRTWDATPDPRRYVSLYFHNAPIDALRRDDIRDWLLWRLWNKRTTAGVNLEEIEEYLTYTENVLEHQFPEGRSQYRPLAVTLEPVQMRHRPLLWYVLFVGAADAVACASMMLMGFQYHRYSWSTILDSFPLRPLTLLSNHKSPSRHITYWLLPHTSTSPAHQPIVFIHGIGVGMHFYLPFFETLLPHCRRHGIGIMALELHQVCSRITTPILPPKVMVEEITRILEYHKWPKCTLLTHSYGSVVAAQLLRSSSAAHLGSMVFVDPVTFSFHPPDVAYNFLRRRPKSASEWQLWYFASMDPDVARTLTRDFRWAESSLWREEVERWQGGKVTVTLAGRDIITGTETTGAYLTRKQGREKWYKEAADVRMGQEWKRHVWDGKGQLEVLYFPRLNHAETFDTKEEMEMLVRVVREYSLG